VTGILGRIELDKRPIDRDRFLTSFEKMRAYGPDRSDFWTEGPAAAGRHLLCVSPAAKHESSIRPVEGIIVVADAVLDGRKELAADLGMTADQMSSCSDTELIRRSYVRWGKECLRYLTGDFAFAVIHLQSQEVFLARDHIGSRPLFWSQRNRSLVFSTSIQTIVSISDWRWTIDERVIAEYLANPVGPLSKPFFNDMHAVPPGGYTTVADTRIESRRWWTPSTKPSEQHQSATEVVARCRSLLERAVLDRVDTDGLVGSHFSGGIDSTGVAVLAARALRSQDRSLVRGYTWSPPESDRHPIEGGSDERVRIQQLAAREDIPVAFGKADAGVLQEFIKNRPLEWEGTADLLDEVPVLHAARADGLRVLLSGWGGDDAFSSHALGYLVSLLLGGRFGRAKQFAHVHGRSLKDPELLLTITWRAVIQPLLPMSLYRLVSPMRPRFRHASFMSVNLMEQHSEFVTHPKERLKVGPSPNKNIERYINAGHVTMRMESWAAWSAPFSFQYRYPLTDRRLLEFLFTTPAEHLFLNEQPRGLARAVLADCIPMDTPKFDVANERSRRQVRFEALQAMAMEAANGEFGDDCPWIDKQKFKHEASKPRDPNQTEDISIFAELFAAVRIWNLYRRAVRNGWV
jgi:asparagine synthase (glutamine-hydrolysing)